MKYNTDIIHSLKETYNLVKTEIQQIKTEKDLIQSIQKAKELKLLCSMKNAILFENSNMNLMTVQFIMSQIYNIKIDENRLLNQFRLNAESIKALKKITSLNINIKN